MALQRNIAVNYISQLYNGLIGIIVMPFYLKFLGAESYGLIAFFMLLQTWFYLLDVGLSQTLSRETVRFKNNVLSATHFFKLYHYISIIFFALALSLVLVLSLSNQWIATHWLKFSHLSLRDVLLCLQIMFICAGLRCMGGIYRGVIQGFEKIVWISIFNIVINTLRFVVVIPVLYVFDFQIQVYFYFQLGVALFEFAVLWFYHRVLIKQHDPMHLDMMPESANYFKQMLYFALLSGGNFILWLGISQSDKLLLSSLLPLADYAYYSIAILLASVIYMISTPMSNVLLPRMTALFSQNNLLQLEQIYTQFAQFISVVVCSIALTIFWNAHEVVLLWSNDVHTADQVAPVLKLYILGNVFLAINAFSYYIQYAHGDVKRHFYGNVCLLILMLPIIYWATTHYGALGAGVVWLSLHALWFFSWTIYVNRHFITHYWQWSFTIIQILVVSYIFSALLHWLYQGMNIYADSIWIDLLALALFGGLLFAVTAVSAPAIRQFLQQKLRG
ncbi:oligosaccharide flippase family protein [Acinetobacter qingfengensis]|uniref:Uncharacterized protein n=1 Tax=Acinetobacter qingfengensis TaxID=1262585 RepID=A0A1E7RD60_9GAMM|nr:oligosaccharide flippase family protein [Acinetobacter qingfengensis]KAA8732078.1 oligosaccharide flippase family protein [Acinetobacter qingfengensis]OEY97157.1 hypothetical protein BJI46_01640 [Acinetobacter qingfengensis]